MISPPIASLAPRIVVADEKPAVAGFIVDVLRADGYAVFHAFDGLAGAELVLGLDQCDMLISDTMFQGTPGVELIYRVRARVPQLPIVYLANLGRSSPSTEHRLPSDVSILREPFTADELRQCVRRLLPPPARH